MDKFMNYGSLCWLCDAYKVCTELDKGEKYACRDDIYEMQHAKVAKRRTKNTAIDEKGGGSK